VKGAFVVTQTCSQHHPKSSRSPQILSSSIAAITRTTRTKKFARRAMISSDTDGIQLRALCGWRLATLCFPSVLKPALLPSMNVDVGIWGKLNRLVTVLLLIAVVIGVAIWYLPVIKNNEAMRKEILNLAAQVRQEEEIARRLETRIKALKNDPKALERVAREKLGYVKPGETMIRFIDPPALGGPSN